MRNVYLALKRSVVFFLLLACVTAFVTPVDNFFYPKADAAETPLVRTDTTTIPDTTAPVILNFWPKSGQKGTAVDILGKNIHNATAVRFGGVLADSIMFLNDTTIRAIVDTGATGNVSVQTPYGTASKPGFTF
ncbi:IPT/TIG domain-containing protein, partial [Niastella populi]|uniref:IPT/TIG domain-containing protein n=1 Tax=Niastella populi TaxID=550983 RepID=UPI001A98F7A1